MLCLKDRQQVNSTFVCSLKEVCEWNKLQRLQLYISCTNTTKNKQKRCIIIQIWICFITPKTLRAEWKWKLAFHSRKRTSLLQLISHRKMKSCLLTSQPECVYQQERLFDIHSAKTASPVMLKLDKVQGQFSPTTDLLLASSRPKKRRLRKQNGRRGNISPPSQFILEGSILKLLPVCTGHSWDKSWQIK